MNVVLGIDCANQAYSQTSNDFLPPSTRDQKLDSSSTTATNNFSAANRAAAAAAVPVPVQQVSGGRTPSPSPPVSVISGGAMASRGGPMVAGTDGRDFLHRERVATHYQISAKNKSRLRYCVYCHYLLGLVMFVKMIPNILDRLDIFILEIEELFVPSPLLWEYVWMLSLLFTFSGLSAVRKNKMRSLRIYQFGILLTGLLPVLGALIWFAKDVKKFIDTRSAEGVQTWQGYPWGMLVYAFLVPALQLHGFSLFFAQNLAGAWRMRSAKKAQ